MPTNIHSDQSGLTFFSTSRSESCEKNNESHNLKWPEKERNHWCTEQHTQNRWVTETLLELSRETKNKVRACSTVHHSHKTWWAELQKPDHKKQNHPQSLYNGCILCQTFDSHKEKLSKNPLMGKKKLQEDHQRILDPVTQDEQNSCSELCVFTTVSSSHKYCNYTSVSVWHVQHLFVETEKDLDSTQHHHCRVNKYPSVKVWNVRSCDFR